MLSFILNNERIDTEAPPGMAMLDFIRKDQALKGTKLVCKEGECGACTVLVGSAKEDEMEYISMCSCIMPLANAHGKHIITIEGLNMKTLTPVQRAMVDSTGTQCGFCTPGFVVSLTGFLLSAKEVSKSEIIASIDGNICRCTGYKSIERAAEQILQNVQELGKQPTIDLLVEKGFIPSYLKGIRNRLVEIAPRTESNRSGRALGGGTDLYVQDAHKMYEEAAQHVFDSPSLKSIDVKNGQCTFGASMTMGDLYRSEVFNEAVSGLENFFKLLSSTQIRNMSTIGGNLVNASPIGDFTILLLGLNASIVLEKEGQKRRVPLRKFYKGYKTLDIEAGELLSQIQFGVPNSSTHVHFEKVSQRNFFDIASVNFASRIELDDDRKIIEAHLAVGGVSAVPLYLKQTNEFLQGKQLDESLIDQCLRILDQEISPISDARGSATYKRRLARQLCIAQFLAIDPKLFSVKKLVGI